MAIRVAQGVEVAFSDTDHHDRSVDVWFGMGRVVGGTMYRGNHVIGTRRCGLRIFDDGAFESGDSECAALCPRRLRGCALGGPGRSVWTAFRRVGCSRNV